MLLLLFFAFIPEDHSLTQISFFQKNSLDYRGAIIRESEFEIIKPFYFYLEELQFFRTENQRIIPYQIKFEWDMGIKKQSKNTIIKIFYNHVCNHGIDHPGVDRRQWNQLALKLGMWNRYLHIQNSLGYVVSPFGPKRKNNNYNWILLHNLIFKKDLKHFSLIFDIEFQGFVEISSLRYSGAFKILLATKNAVTGYARERHYGLEGETSKATELRGFFGGIFEKLPEFRVLYGYMFKNPEYSFFSNFSVKYSIPGNIKILTGLKTVSPPKTQQPRFYDYKGGVELNVKELSLSLYHRERRDGNLFDGKMEEINALALSKIFSFKNNSVEITIDYIFKRRDYPYNLHTDFKLRRKIFGTDNSIWNANFETRVSYLRGKEENGFILEAGPSFVINTEKEIELCFRQKISSAETLEHYGIFEQRFFISVKFGKNKRL